MLQQIKILQNVKLCHFTHCSHMLEWSQRLCLQGKAVQTKNSSWTAWPSRWSQYNPSTHWKLPKRVSHSTNHEPSFIPVLHKTYCTTKQMDSSVINVSVSSNRKISFKSKYLPIVACKVVTLCSPGGTYHRVGGYMLRLSAECILKMKAVSTHKIFASTFQIT